MYHPQHNITVKDIKPNYIGHWKKLGFIAIPRVGIRGKCKVPA